MDGSMLEAPWWTPWRGVGAALVERLSVGDGVVVALESVRRALVSTDRAPAVVRPRFVSAAACPRDEPYEAYLERTGQVPTRETRHDLFNGVVWLARPPWKARLNMLHAQVIARDGVGPVRGAVRDALTLFDENGAVLLDAPPALRAALAARDWATLFGPLRDAWRAARVEIVGHALLEQLATAPRPSLTAHVLFGDPCLLTPADWAAKPFCPLPVLGVPGWWAANETPSFYADAQVFRAPPPTPRVDACA